jgi:hypothetical protein
MSGARYLLDETLEQRTHHVGPVLRAERLLLAAGEQVRDQRQGQRVAVGEREHRRMPGLGDPPRPEVGATVVRRQVAQRHDAREVGPAGVDAPGAGGWVAPGDDDEHLHGQLGQEGLAQPRVQRGQCLVGVDEEHPARLLRQRLQRRRALREPQRLA